MPKEINMAPILAEVRELTLDHIKAQRGWKDIVRNNPEDKFVLHFANSAYDLLIVTLDYERMLSASQSKAGAYADKLNELCKEGHGYRTGEGWKLANQICAEIYQQLKKELI